MTMEITISEVERKLVLLVPTTFGGDNLHPRILKNVTHKIASSPVWIFMDF